MVDRTYKVISEKVITNILRNLLLQYPCDEYHDREWSYIQEHSLRYAYILSRIPKSNRKISVIDLGTLCGHMALLVQKLFCYHVVAADVRINDDVRRRLEANGIEIRSEIELSNHDSIPLESNSFDIVLFNDVLEHLYCNPRLVFLEIARVLKDNGLIILSTPNFANLYNRALALFGKNPQRFRENGHFREYTMEECLFLLSEDFKIENASLITTVGRHTNKLSSNRKLKLFCLPYLFLCKIIPSFRDTILIKARKCVCTKTTRNRLYLLEEKRIDTLRFKIANEQELFG